MKKLLLISVAFILLQADYNKGFKFYQKYIKKPTKITSTISSNILANKASYAVIIVIFLLFL